MWLIIMVWQLTVLVLIFMKRNIASGAAVIHADSSSCYDDSDI